MTKSGTLAALCCLLLAAPTFVHGKEKSRVSGDDDELPAAAVFARASRSVYLVVTTTENGHGQGSAVALSPTVLVTNRHVVNGAKSIEVQRGDSKWSAKLLAIDPKRDLALLETEGLKASPCVVRLTADVAVGERVYAIGSPRGLELTFSDGIVSAFRDDKGGRLLQHTAPISPGSSGGGLFDSSGRLVGVNAFFVGSGQNLNFALPTEWVDELRFGANSQVGVAVPPVTDEPEWTLKSRPQSIRCAFDEELVWGRFRRGDEILDRKKVTGLVRVSRFESQLVNIQDTVDLKRVDGDYVLWHLDSEDGSIGFAPAVAAASRTSAQEASQGAVYLFDMAGGAISVTRFVPFDYFGQFRWRTRSGPCTIIEGVEDKGKSIRKSLTDAQLTDYTRAKAACQEGDGRACRAAAEFLPFNDLRRLVHLVRGCELKDVASCSLGLELARHRKMADLEKKLRGLGGT